MSKQKKARIYIFIFCVVVGLISSLGLSTFMYRTLEILPKQAKDFFPTNIIVSIQQNPKHGMMFVTMIFLFALIIVFIVLNAKDKNQFASELDKITDKIYTPKRVGQNQYGDAKWLEKREIEKAFHKYELKIEEKYQYLLVKGEQDGKIIEGLEKEALAEIKKLPPDLPDEVLKDKIYEIVSKIIDNYLEKRDSAEHEKQSKKTSNTAPVQMTSTAPIPPDNTVTKQNEIKRQAITTSKVFVSKEEKEELKNLTKKFFESNKSLKYSLLSRFNNQKETEDTETLADYIGKSFIRNAGLVVHYTKSKKQENIFSLNKDVHSIILGSTGSSKTRSVILQTICLLGLFGESIIINDPKGEIYQYTKAYLERLGYEIIVIDFRDRKLSERYNFLQPVIEAVKEGEVDTAIDLAWDITSSLVGEPKGETIWHNGECCVIVSAILCVVFDNKDNPQYQNLTNVYHFIANMCQPDENNIMPLDRYLKTLEDTHPAKGIMAQIKVAPSRTRGSFLTSALATLKLFTNPNTYNMTCESDFHLWDIGQKKTALYMILPDEKTTFYPLVSLFVYQLYIELAEKSEKKGGRLNVRVNFTLDEFGNFARIPAIENMLSVSRGRGMRFNLVLQDYSQLEKKYDKSLSNIIRANCQCKVFLKSDEFETVKNISDSLGKYTSSSFSRSASASSTQSSSNSNSMNLIGVPLLTPEQVKKIDRPHALVMYSGYDPFIATLPDLSEWSFNKALGMGNEIHNMLLRMLRKKDRKSKLVKELVLWKIWEQFSQTADKGEETEQQPKYDMKYHIDNLIYGSDIEEKDTKKEEAKTAEERLQEEESNEKQETEKTNTRQDNLY